MAAAKKGAPGRGAPWDRSIARGGLFERSTANDSEFPACKYLSNKDIMQVRRGKSAWQL